MDTIDKNTLLGYSLVVIEQHTEKHLMMGLDRSPDCMSNFVKTIEIFAHDIYNKKQQFRNLTLSVRKQNKVQAVKCWIC